jgi:hypothetical protein
MNGIVTVHALVCANRNGTWLSALNRMVMYYFDFRSSGVVSVDDEGVDLADTDAAHKEAIGSLSDAIRDISIQGVHEQQIGVEVRDGLGAIFEVSATLRSKILRRQ